MAAHVPAHDAIAVGIAKAVRDAHGAGHGMVLASHTQIGDTAADHLASPNCLALLTRFVGELHGAGLDNEKRPTGEGERG